MPEDILTKEDKDAVRQALKDAERLRKELMRAKRAGIDVSELEKRLADTELSLRNIYRVYVSPGERST
jgi:C4-type Zn-finger protein